jgi:hypothetical protein
MNQGSNEISNKVTVVIFKDNHAARTFQVPLDWISKLGLFLSILIGTTILSCVFALKYYRIAFKSNPDYTQELEQELVDLKANLKTSTLQTPEGSPPVSASPLHGTLNLPVFTSLPPSSLNSLSDPLTGPVTIQFAKAEWHNRILRVHFALRSTPSDNGSHQGKVLVIARGTETFLTYPAKTMNPTGVESFLAPENGEPFTVSRYKEVTADFGPIHTRELIHEVEILLFNNSGKLFAYERINP